MADEPCGESADFDIREFPDLRRLRASCRGTPPDGGDIPPAEDAGDEVSLEHSTNEEAIEFLRALIDRDEPGDPMTEFLQDE